MRYDLGPVGRIPPGEGRQFRVGATRVAVFRARDGGVFATQAYCPHRRGPLADGIIGGGKVICPLHGYRFDLRTGCGVGNDCGPLVTYPASVTADGRILLDLGRAAPTRRAPVAS